MLDIDNLGEINKPDGLPDLYNQVPRMHHRVTRWYRLNSLYVRVAPVLGAYRSGSPAGNVIMNYEIPCIMVRDSETLWPYFRPYHYLVELPSQVGRGARHFHKYHSTCQLLRAGYHSTPPNDEKLNGCEQKPQITTDRTDAHFLVSVSEAPSPMENINHSSFVAGGRGAPAVASSS
eukprot:6172511-Pleurochrysis_carterae.AAC.1